MAWEVGQELKLTKRARAAMPFIRAAVNAGIGAKETSNILKAAGMGARYQTVLDVHRAFTYAYDNPAVYVPKDIRQRPNADLIPRAVQDQNKAWRTTMWYDVYDENEQDIVRNIITIDSDNLLTVDEYIQYTGQYGNKYGFDGQELLDIGFDSITFSNNPRNRV